MKVYSNFRWGFTGELQTMEVQNGRVVRRTNNVLGDLLPSSAIDLGGQYILPSFVDAHCHILPTGLNLTKLSLDGLRTKEEVLQKVLERHQAHPDGWLMAVHYNQTLFPDGEHITRWELDQISDERPIHLEHVNAHACVVNSAALREANVGDDELDPTGGTYRRGADGRIDGVLLEKAYEHVTHFSPMPSVEGLARAIVLAGQKMHEFGISCASDMSTGYYNLEQELQAYKLAADLGCPIHMRLYLQWSQVLGPRAIASERLKELLDDLAATGKVRIDGVKIFADGGISSATAAIYGKFKTINPPRKQKGSPAQETDGQLIYSPERLNSMVLTAHDAGYKVAIHSIGDYSTDLVFDALEQTAEGSRHRIEHAMIMSDGQIERMQRIGCYCTYQPEFLMKLGPAYRMQLGDERASRLIRSRSTLDAGIRVSFNSDRPIVAGNPWDGILTASDRPAGYDPSENCTRSEAIQAYTAGGSDVNGDKAEMGTLQPGSFAHFQTYELDPLTNPKPQLKNHITE